MKTERNTYGLPQGEAIRREMVKVFREQRAQAIEVLSLAKSFKADQDIAGGGGRLPLIPDVDWGALFLGPLEMAKRFVPLLEVIWDRAGANLLARVGEDPAEWSVEDPNLQKKIGDAAMAFCEATNATTTRQLDQALEDTRDALRTGASVQTLTSRVNAIFDQAEKWRARRIATSEASRAYHAAEVESAIQSEVVAGFKWLASEDACPYCLTVARRVPAVRIGQPFATMGDNPDYSVIQYPPLHPHCCLPETPIFAPFGVKGVEAAYDGPVVRIHFSDGSDVTVTPNHMLLTREGFARASSLVEGEDVIRCGLLDGMPLDVPDNYGKPTAIKDVVRSLSESGGVRSMHVPVSPEYLHDDAAFCDGEIRVVSANSVFTNGLYSKLLKAKHGKQSLDVPHWWRVLLPCDSPIATVLFALRDATDGGVCSLREFKSLVLRHTRISEGLGFAVGSGLNPDFEKAAAYCRARDAKSIGDCLDRFPGFISTAKVIKIDKDTIHYKGPVYDVETLTSLYAIGNGIVSSNCQCSLEEILFPEYGGPRDVAWGTTLEQPEPEQEDIDAAENYQPAGPGEGRHGRDTD